MFKIKFRYIVCFFLLANASYTFAQDFKPQFSIGMNHGLTASTINFVPDIKQHSLLAYNGGITARFISEKNIGLQLELNYSQRGWDEVLDNAASFSRTLNYVELPFLTHIYFGNKNFRFFVNLGPKIAYLLNDDTNTNLTVLTEPEQIDLIENNFDYGICAGMGVEFHTSTLSYMIEGRYNYGLSDIFSNTKQDYFSSSSNRNISINFILLYNLGQK